MNSLSLDGFDLQEIKTKPIEAYQLEELVLLSGSYESLFSKRAKKYAALGLKDQKLNEEDYKHLILNHYTFLKRPVIIIDTNIFIGSDKKNLEKLTQFLSHNNIAS